LRKVHFGPYGPSLSVHFYNMLFSGLEPMTVLYNQKIVGTHTFSQ
jgi:hypothetical protein